MKYDTGNQQPAELLTVWLTVKQTGEEMAGEEADLVTEWLTGCDLNMSRVALFILFYVMYPICFLIRV